MKNRLIAFFLICLANTLLSQAQSRVWKQFNPPAINGQQVISLSSTSKETVVSTINDNSGGNRTYGLDTYDGIGWKNSLPMNLSAFGISADVEYDNSERLIVSSDITGKGLFIRESGKWSEQFVGDSFDGKRNFRSLSVNPKNGDIWVTTMIDPIGFTGYHEILRFDGIKFHTILFEESKYGGTPADITVSKDGATVYALFYTNKIGLIAYDALTGIKKKQYPIPYSSKFDNYTIVFAEYGSCKLLALDNGTIIHTYIGGRVTDLPSEFLIGGVTSFNPITEQWVAIDSNIRSICAGIDSKNQLWYPNLDKLRCYDFATKKVVDSIDVRKELAYSYPNQIQAINFVGNRMWIGTLLFGVAYADNVLSVSENETALENSAVYPNPAEQGKVVFVPRYSREQTKPPQVYLSTVLGQILPLKINIATNEELKIDLGSIPAGWYLLHINDNGEITVQSVVVK
jgi:hypothetical protein